MSTKQRITKAGIFGQFWSDKYQKQGALLGNDPSYLARRLVQMLNKPTIIMDLACGYGRDTLFYTQFGHRVIAIDPSVGGVQKAKELYTELKYETYVAEADFIVGTISSIRPERSTASIGAIVCNRGLHMLDDSELEEFEYVASKVLKPGGYLLASGTSETAFNPDKEIWVPGKEGHIYMDRQQPYMHHHYIDESTLIKTFSRRFMLHAIREMPRASDDPRSIKPAKAVIAQRNLTS